MTDARTRPLQIEFGGEQLELLPEKAIWWAGRRTLLVADVHCGKDATFRAMGVPVPSGGTDRDLQRLSELVRRTEAERLVILGDLLHARLAKHPDLVECIARWRKLHPQTRMILVRGNHDRSSGAVPLHWEMEICEETTEEDGFVFCHAPPRSAERPTLAGHVHPTVFLPDYDGSVVNVPCFVCEGNCLILPSFGTFTGGYTISPSEGRRIYVVTPKRVVAMPK
jgi:DNA ligase-associated metallophosphoesterase